MNSTDIIGFTGTALLAVTMLPQVYKTFKHKRAHDLAWMYLILQIFANILFLIYGYLLPRLPIILSNAIVMACSLSLVYAKLFFTGPSPESSPLLNLNAQEHIP